MPNDDATHESKLIRLLLKDVKLSPTVQPHLYWSQLSPNEQIGNIDRIGYDKEGSQPIKHIETADKGSHLCPASNDGMCMRFRANHVQLFF